MTISTKLSLAESSGGIAPTSDTALAAETSTKEPNPISVPSTRTTSGADETLGGAQDDCKAASVGPDGDAGEQDVRERADRYLAELIEEVGEPSPEEVAEAEAWAARIESALEKARAAQ